MENVDIEGVAELHLQDEHTVFDVTGSDVVQSFLCQLDWSEERKLERAMTSFRLTLTEEFMPDLLAQVCQLLTTERQKHKVQQLARDLLDKYHIKLLGIQVGSLIFLLQHCSLEDREWTFSQEERQREVQRTLLTFLPEWVSCSAQWTVGPHTPSAEEGLVESGIKSVTVVSFVHSMQLWEGEDSEKSPSEESTPQVRSSPGMTSKTPMKEMCEEESRPSMAGEPAPVLRVPTDLSERDSPAEVTILSAGDSHLREPDLEREQPSSPAGDSAARAEGVGEGWSGSCVGDSTSPAVTQAEDPPVQAVSPAVAGMSPGGVPQPAASIESGYVQMLPPSALSLLPEHVWQDIDPVAQGEMQDREPDMRATERFQCAQDPDVEVFSLCHVDRQPPRVNVSYERCGTVQNAPVKYFTEDGECVRTSSRLVGKVSYRRVTQGQYICPYPRPGRFITFCKSPSANHVRLDNDLQGKADVQRVTVTSAEPFNSEVETEFTIHVGPHRSFDVDDTGELYAVLEERRASASWPRVRLYRRLLPHAVSVYHPPPGQFQPSDLCFYTLRGQRVLLITDYLNSSIHVATMYQDKLQFQRYLRVKGPSLPQPTAITVDTKGRLWLACRGGSILTLEQTD